MRKLPISDAMRMEFATIERIWTSTARTRRVDALILSWVKYEKQLRRLFSFFVFQHPRITRGELDAVIATFADNSRLYPETFISGMKALGVTPLPKLLHGKYKSLWREVKRIKSYRNKLIHGQLTGKAITSQQLEQDVIYIIKWISALAVEADQAFGYDGLRRNTYIAAKSTANIQVKKYPFTKPNELKIWLSRLSNTTH